VSNVESERRSVFGVDGMEKMPRHYIAAFKVSIRSKLKLVDGSRSAQNAAKNVSPTTVARPVTLVSIPRVLPIALVIALHKALTKNLR
jgi:hypothetical protein